MPLWGLRDFASGNNKPLYANTSNVFGVSLVEAQASNNRTRHLTPGWVEITRGRGYIQSISIANAGSNIRTAGFVTLDGGGYYTQANISYGINNISNTVNTVTIINRGDGYVNTINVYVANTGTGGFYAQFTTIMGGRFGRNNIDTLVATKNITGDADANTILDA